MWIGAWGMAASAGNNDFVHHLGRSLNLPVNPTNFASLERTPVEGAADIPALTAGIDQKAVVVIELGDNVPADGLDAFATEYGKLLDVVKVADRPVCVTTWWTNADKDAIISDACKAHGGHVTNISDLRLAGRDPVGIYANPDIDGHPKDNAHAAIADRIPAVIR